MKELILKTEKATLKKELKHIFGIIQDLTEDLPLTVTKQVKILFEIRSNIYEDINQLQHKALIIKVAGLLKKEYPEIVSWSWHPKQTSHPDEADLTGYDSKKQVIVNAEVTTSIRPTGTIDQRMKSTLESLNRKKGKLFYCVQTPEMYRRAELKIRKNRFNIMVYLV